MTTIPLEDQVCKCGHWYDEHTRPDARSATQFAPYCEGCWQVITPQGAFGTDVDLKAAIGVGHEHEFIFSEENSTPEAIADRGGDPDQWPQHVKDHFST